MYANKYKKYLLKIIIYPSNNKQTRKYQTHFINNKMIKMIKNIKRSMKKNNINTYTYLCVCLRVRYRHETKLLILT